MKKYLGGGVLITALLLSGLAMADPIVVKDVGLNGSESIRYDLFFDRYIVANINGSDPGFISTITPDGKVDQLKFIEGGKNGVQLDDPRGTYMRDGTLYVADKQSVRMFDLASGQPTGSVDVPDAITLNDLTVAANHTIFVTDSGSNDNAGAIYRISPEGQVTKIASGPNMHRPNGIDMTPNFAVVGGANSVMYAQLDGQDVVWMDENGNETHRVTLPSGRLDGLVYTDNGVAMVSSQMPGVVYAIDGDDRIVTLHEGVPGVAAIGWDSLRNRVLMPQTRDGALTFGAGPNIAGHPSDLVATR